MRNPRRKRENTQVVNLSPPQPRLLRSRIFGWKLILIAVQQIIMILLLSKLNMIAEIDDKVVEDHIFQNAIQPDGISITEPNMYLTLAGISYSDNTTSDFAINFLVNAACNYGIQSHILLKERDATKSLTKKIAALTHHMQPLPTKGVISHPKCMKWIHITQSPSDEYLLNMTRSRIPNSLRKQYESITMNNPLDRDNRIARIQRSREYQREKLREILELQNELQDRSDDDDWKVNSVIAVLDLDMFAYPTPSDILDTAMKSILSPQQPSRPKQFHAICSNGVFVRVKDRDYYDIRHYDTYSTILLDDHWLYREPGYSKLKKADKKLWHMNQSQTFHYILKKARLSKAGGGAMGDNMNSYDLLPVRSCFGGLALYRADIWLDHECRYDKYHEDDAAFTSSQYRHACEHVVFHECLRRKMMRASGKNSGGGNGFNIAVKPDMTTLWHTT